MFFFIKLHFNSQHKQSTYSDDLQKKVCDFQKDITGHALENVQKVKSLWVTGDILHIWYFI